MAHSDFESFIRDVPDFPEQGILFRDITPLLAAPEVLSASVDALAAPFYDEEVSKVAGIEARGFIFGPMVAERLKAGFIPIRKEGKLPWETASLEYALEYGTDCVEVHSDAISDVDRVLIVDDVLATGGTGQATIQLIESLGGEVVGVSVLVELDFLNGRGKLNGTRVHSLVRYDAG